MDPMLPPYTTDAGKGKRVSGAIYLVGDPAVAPQAGRCPGHCRFYRIAFIETKTHFDFLLLGARVALRGLSAKHVRHGCRGMP